MNLHAGLFLTFFWLALQHTLAQGPLPASTPLFGPQEPLSLALRASIKSLKGDTNDSTYLNSMLYFNPHEGVSDSLGIQVRARGNARREVCFYPPIALRFSDSNTRGTPFEGQKEVKLVLPCQIGGDYEDYVLKELLAYKLFEQVSPYFYATRLVQLDFLEVRGNRERRHELWAFLLEDHSAVARRLNGKRVRRNVPPEMQDALAGVRDNLFQFMIGNTDYSMRMQHNQRLYYLDGTYVTLPYDFDMSGLVNAPYATVNNIQNLDSNIEQVTERLYKGYARDTTLMQQVRGEFLAARPAMEKCLNDLEPYFKDRRQMAEAREYLDSFFHILENDRLFERRIIEHMRD